MQRRQLFALVSTLTLIACDSNSPSSGLGGSYRATSFITIENDDTTDVLDSGGLLELDFYGEERVEGQLRLPQKETLSFRGAWREDMDTVRFKTNPPSLIEDLRFAHRGLQLFVNTRVGTVTYQLKLERNFGRN